MSIATFSMELGYKRNSRSLLHFNHQSRHQDCFMKGPMNNMQNEECMFWDLESISGMALVEPRHGGHEEVSATASAIR